MAMTRHVIPKISWRNKADVIAFAKLLGPSNIVVKHASRPNYNITHISRHDLWNKPDVTVVYSEICLT
jgi:hypothetical protein